MPEIPPADVLLCERCGYRIGELSPDLPCPECGKPIAESLPERRTVHPTIWQTLTRPRWSLDHMRIDERGSKEWRRRCLLASKVGMLPALFAVLLTQFFVPMHGKWQPASLFVIFVLLPAIFFLMWGILIALTKIEAAGLRYFGRRRGFRITGELSRCICGYGAAGWILAGAGLAYVLVCLWIPMYFPSPSAASTGRAPGGVVLSLAWIGAVPIVAGFLFFEVFAAMGMQRCRFANQPRKTSGEANEAAANLPAADHEPAPGRPDTAPTIDHAATPTDATDPDR